MENNNVSLISKELEKKEVELKTLKQTNKTNKFLSYLKIIMVVLLLVLEIFIGKFLLEKYGILDSSKNSKSLDSQKTNVGVLDINKQLTMEYVNELISKMEDFKKEDSIKEILIKMNCPGGSPVAADEFSEYIKEFDKTKNINMYVQTMAASGGYYIASAIKPIVANKNAIVGSIGVIMPKYTIKNLADKIGIEEDNVVVGEYKVPITYFENVSDSQKKYLKDNMLLPTYDNFIGVVAENRNLEVVELEKFAQGKIYIANKKEISGILVDEIKNFTQYSIEIKDRLSKEYKVNSENVIFIEDSNKKSKLSMFKINLNINDVLENNKILLN